MLKYHYQRGNKMKKITKAILLDQSKKESTLSLREAILSHVDFEIEWHCRKNMRKDWRQAYDIIQKRITAAHDFEIKPNRLYLLNYFLRNYIVVENFARDWWKFDGFKSEKEAAKIYKTALLFLSNIYCNIIAGQYDLDLRGYKNHCKEWNKEIK